MALKQIPRWRMSHNINAMYVSLTILEIDSLKTTWLFTINSDHQWNISSSPGEYVLFSAKPETKF